MRDVIPFCAEPASLGSLVAEVSAFQTLQMQAKLVSAVGGSDEAV